MNSKEALDACVDVRNLEESEASFHEPLSCVGIDRRALIERARHYDVRFGRCKGSIRVQSEETTANALQRTVWLP